MAQGQQLFILSISVLIFLIVLSKCNSYPLFNELPGMYELIKIFEKITFFFQI
jgi:hypothetical protein